MDYDDMLGELYLEMQEKAVQDALTRALSATPEEMGQAALRAAQRERELLLPDDVCDNCGATRESHPRVLGDGQVCSFRNSPDVGRGGLTG